MFYGVLDHLQRKNANLCWFTHTVGALFAGTVFMYLAYRVPKRGAIAIMGIIVGAVGLLMGMFWSGPVGIVVGGIDDLTHRAWRSTRSTPQDRLLMRRITFVLLLKAGAVLTIASAGRSQPRRLIR